MKRLIVLVFFLSLTAYATPRPLDQVRAYAGKHKVSVTHWRGKVWVEADGLDPFGVGDTVDEAAQSFLDSAGMMDRENNHPQLKKAPGNEGKPSNATPWVCPDGDDCI